MRTSSIFSMHSCLVWFCLIFSFHSSSVHLFSFFQGKLFLWICRSLNMSCIGSVGDFIIPLVMYNWTWAKWNAISQHVIQTMFCHNVYGHSSLCVAVAGSNSHVFYYYTTNIHRFIFIFSLTEVFIKLCCCEIGDNY